MRASLRVFSTSEAGLLALEDLFFLAAVIFWRPVFTESGNVINDSRNTSYNGLYSLLGTDTERAGSPSVNAFEQARKP
ncbi:hypothetical protein B9Z19DRAFT_1133145 [Tuber borchii]|uniref:Uncharacterized protein n=1 Tax=Tuber borchii TaxID=42251 RepID=A0A2T6ZGD0_TUBBO|nr:hypothetical protein B9Z19DRAFT_1133145 [Tuber borchii]